MARLVPKLSISLEKAMCVCANLLECWQIVRKTKTIMANIATQLSCQTCSVTDLIGTPRTDQIVLLQIFAVLEEVQHSFSFRISRQKNFFGRYRVQSFQACAKPERKSQFSRESSNLGLRFRLLGIFFFPQAKPLSVLAN